MCSRAVRYDKRKLGGRGAVVEMDESLVFKIKYNRESGLKRKQIWVFGMVERKDQGRCHIQIVRNRKAETLLAIIYDQVNESSVIHSDSWSSYNKITEFLDLNHQTVNHSVNFVDPESGACINKCEGKLKIYSYHQFHIGSKQCKMRTSQCFPLLIIFELMSNEKKSMFFLY